MAKTIKWGIAGLGNIARKFAGDLKGVAQAELIGVASTSRIVPRLFKRNLTDKKLMISMKTYTVTPK